MGVGGFVAVSLRGRGCKVLVEMSRVVKMDKKKRGGCRVLEVARDGSCRCQRQRRVQIGEYIDISDEWPRVSSDFISMGKYIANLGWSDICVVRVPDDD